MAVAVWPSEGAPPPPAPSLREAPMAGQPPPDPSWQSGPDQVRAAWQPQEQPPYDLQETAKHPIQPYEVPPPGDPGQRSPPPPPHYPPAPPPPYAPPRP